ncbi:deoxyribonuclease IV [candidate division KSB1 bacterium]|nr:deoxyribonuclease IV [candidate division KSB1 bacterium]
MTNNQILLGAHVSIAGGLERAPVRGTDLECTAIQIFSKNQVQWQAAPLLPETIQKYQQALQHSSVTAVCVHDSYLINLGSGDAALLQKSRSAFVDEMQRTAALGIPYLIFHPGVFKTGDDATCLQTITASLDWCFEHTGPLPIQVLLETTAGQGQNVGYRFEHLAEIISQVRLPQQVGCCLDTCHVFAAGYDLRDAASYHATFEAFDHTIGLDKLKVIHLNDSLKPFGSRVDRHANIGQGQIGLAAFALLMNDPRFKTVPKILETPGGDEWFRINLRLLRSLVSG